MEVNESPPTHNLRAGNCALKQEVRLLLTFRPCLLLKFKKIMKTLKLNKYKTNVHGTLRAATEQLAVRVDKIIEYYSFAGQANGQQTDKEGTVVVTEGGEHYVKELFAKVTTDIKKAR
jgi:hypothetical protein